MRITLGLLIAMLAIGACGKKKSKGKGSGGDPNNKDSSSEVKKACLVTKESKFGKENQMPGSMCIEILNTKKWELQQDNCKNDGGEVRGSCPTDNVSFKCKGDDKLFVFYKPWENVDTCPEGLSKALYSHQIFRQLR